MSAVLPLMTYTGIPINQWAMSAATSAAETTCTRVRTHHVMNDLWPMVAQFSHSLEYVHLLAVFELLPNEADGSIKSAL